MYRTLLAARLGTVIFLVVFAVLSFVVRASPKAKLGVALLILLSFFVDATISYVRPQFERQEPSNSMLAGVLKLSVLNSTNTTQIRKLVMVVLTGVLFVGVLAWLLR